MELSILKCPDCSGGMLQKKDDESLECQSCHTKFPIIRGIYDLRPRRVSIEEGKMNYAEESVWKQSLNSSIPIWKAIIDSRRLLLNFDTEILDKVKLYGRVLEIGAGRGLCGYIAKNRYPAMTLYTSDISPSAIHLAKRSINDFRYSPNVFVICDAGHLPFIDEVFDFVIGNGCLHHFDSLVNSMRDINRVLKKGGRYLGCGEGAVATASKYLHRHVVRRGVTISRQKRWHIKEGTYSFREWQRAFAEAGFSKIYVNLLLQNRQHDCVKVRMYNTLASLLPEFVVKALLVAGIRIELLK